MSSPPSPRRKLSDVPSTTAAIFDPTTSASYYTGVTVGLSPVLAVTTTSTSVLPQPWINTSDPIAPPATFFSHTSSSSIESQAPLTRIESTSSATAVIDVQAIAGPSTATLPPSAGRGGGRRSKTHVANACNNCKRAHLSCDVDRPCNRCVQTGKGDTCRNVPHKKRGRPRLRDEGDFGVQQQPRSTIPAQGPVEAGPSTTADRVIAGSRHRRAASLRTLLSYPDASGPLSRSLPASGAPAILGPAFAPQPRTSRLTQGLVTPIAFLDLDLVIMKANAAFQTLMGIREIRGVRLTDIATPLEGDSFQNTRNHLRAEREAKEPSYLPPILQPGLDPVSRVTDQNVEEITRGFDDQHYTWTFRLEGGERNLPVRLRLAKTSLYFVTLFLPPLPEAQTEQATIHNPAPPPVLYQIPVPPQFLASPPHFTDPHLPGHEHAVQSAPPSPFYHSQSIFPGANPPPLGPPSQFSSGTYPHHDFRARYNPTAPPSQAYYQQPAFHTYPPHMPPPSFQTIQERQASASTIPGPSSFITPSTYNPTFSSTRPRSETMESLGRHIQTRLRADSGVIPSVIHSSPPQPEAEFSRVSSDDSAGSAAAQGQSPRKRRRTGMNLDDVLHRR
ncbi:hypothetical protein BDV97DRAFT_370326 [Delphinella strobiligena]|nr:hypothetical protein BDV97DRAFT_370326 [Delphinella strobiligena]